MNIAEIIQHLYNEINPIEDKGQLASYIPELQNVNPNSFGVHISTLDDFHFGTGNCNDKFSIQSIVKVLSLVMAYRLLGGKLWERVKVEPSGTAFNSLVQLEVENGIPRNPFINAGALVVTDILLTHLDNPKEDFLTFIKTLSNGKNFQYSGKIVVSEKKQDTAT